MKIVLYPAFYLLIAVSFLSCKGDGEDNGSDPGDKTAPEMTSTMPADGATRVSVTTGIFVYYDESISLADNYQITANGQPVTATASGSKLTLNLTLSAGTTYNILISSKSVRDDGNNYAAAVSFSFTTKYPQPSDGKYEAEYGQWSAGNSVLTSISGYSGTGYVGGFHNANDFVTFEMENITAGKYDLLIGYSTADYGTKICNVDVNGIKGTFELLSSAGFSESKFATVVLKTGTNIIKILPDWTWFHIDYAKIVPNSSADAPFNLDADPVTPSPSPQAVKLYNFLKANFLSNIIS